jgi:hypothetical protein
MKHLTKENIHSRLCYKLKTRLDRPYYSILKHEPRWKLQNAFNGLYNTLSLTNITKEQLLNAYNDNL